MVTKIQQKKELIKTIVAECPIELDTKKLRTMDVLLLEEILKDFRNLKLTSLTNPIPTTQMDNLKDGEGYIK